MDGRWSRHAVERARIVDCTKRSNEQSRQTKLESAIVKLDTAKRQQTLTAGGPGAVGLIRRIGRAIVLPCE